KDARLLHSAYANASNEERTLLSLTFHPGFAALPAGIQARIKSIFMRERDFDGMSAPDDLRMALWPERQRKKIAHLFPVCADDVPPQHLNFSPNLELLHRT